MSYRLNIWDVGGQKTIRSYWKNYYEQTDGVIWVVDSADKRRLGTCKEELHGLLTEEVTINISHTTVLRLRFMYKICRST